MRATDHARGGAEDRLATSRITRAARLPALFLVALGIVLIGYAFLQRAFAYIGVPPFYIGEMVLAVGLLAALTGVPVRLLNSPVVWSIVAFGAWGAARTFPYVGTYRVDALRDAVLWGYGAFTILVAAALLRTGALPRAIRGYARWVPWFLVWLPFYFLATRIAGREALMSIFAFKPGDVAVHLAGVAGLVLLGIGRSVPRSRRLNAWLAGLWLVGFSIAAVLNRGGLVAVAAAMLTLLAFRPVRMIRRARRMAPRLVVPLLIVIASGSIGSGVFGLTARVSDSPDDERDLSPTQLIENVESIFGVGYATADLEGTREWRLKWWKTIENYTLRGRYFWTGKGFGVNLAEDDGFELMDVDLRSPHNGHLNVLARAGVPGIVLWVLVLSTFAGTMILGFLRARRAGLERLADVHLWVLSYWVAFVVNAAFDVYLEGPQGGIWFWSLMGAGVALGFAGRDAIAQRARLARGTAAQRMNVPFTSSP